MDLPPPAPPALAPAARHVEPVLLALPLDRIAEAGLGAASQPGVVHADVRVHALRTFEVRLHDAVPERLADDVVLGVAVRVVVDGAYGFAAGVDVAPAAVVALTRRAVAMGRHTARLGARPLAWAYEPVWRDTWLSAYELDPFDVPADERLDLLADRSQRLLAAPGIQHVETSCTAVREATFYADLAGSRLLQQRVRVGSDLTALSLGPDGSPETLRTLAPPAGRGWEWLTAGPAAGCWDWDDELARLPELLAERHAAPSVEPGTYDLVIAPSNLWLTIHESVGHATELDRVLGYEANYAGTSFVGADQVGRLQYGSAAMTVTGDRTTPHGLATVGYDDEAVAAQEWTLVDSGVLAGFQLDRRMALERGLGRSNGCAYADSPLHVPVQRMPNVSLAAAPGGPDVGELIAGVRDGIYIEGDKSWSIDMQRYNFQFTGQRFWRIRDGALAGQLKDVAYQATTTDFWNSLEAVGGPQTYVLGGALNCGKGQPGQVAPVSHGCPAGLFRSVRVLNTAGGQA
ncbi:MAG: peptidase [Mycobacterium sp.]|nr:peptidase [Mycobacterium sp.]